MTTTQKNAIGTPSEGLIVYDTDADALFVYVSGAWTKLANATEVSFRAIKTSTQAISANIDTALDFHAESYDVGSSFDLTTDRFQPTVAGKYLIRFSVDTMVVSTAYGQASILKNGSQVSSHFVYNNGAGANWLVPVAATVVDLNGTTDYISFSVLSNGAGTIHNSAAHTYAEGYLLSGGTGGGGGGSADHLGNHVMTQALTTSGNWISGDGGAEGILIDGSGNVGIGSPTPNALLDVAGIIRAQQICDEAGANCKDISTGWNTGNVATTRAINTNSGSGLTGGGDLSNDRNIAMNVDSTTIEIATNTVQVKDGGITSAKIADGTIVSADVSAISIGKITNAPAEYFTYMPAGSECTDGYVLKWTSSNRWECATDLVGVSDHGALTGLGDDDHTQYALLAGRGSGQSFRGGTAASANLTLESTSDSTKGYVLLQPNGGSVGIGTTAPVASAALQLDSTNKGFLPPRMTTASRNGIASPATGLIVYDTDLSTLFVYNSTAWQRVSSTEVAFRAYKTSNSSINSGTETVMDWDAEQFDTANAFNTTTERFQPTVAGYYFISASAWINDLGDGNYLQLAVRRNGSAAFKSQVVNAHATNDGMPTATGVVYMDGSTHYLDFTVVHNAGVAKSLMGDATYTYVSGFLISGGTGGGGGGTDNMGDHSATQNIILGSHWLSGDGNNEGLSIDSSGNVGIGTATAAEKLTVDGLIHSLSGGIKFPDGSIQTTANSSSTTGGVTWQRIAAYEVPSTTSSYTFSGLNGNVDGQYRVMIRAINQSASGLNYVVRPNNDAATNYGMTYGGGADGVGATGGYQSAWTGFYAGYAIGAGKLNHSEVLIYAKSGVNRTSLASVLGSGSGTNIQYGIVAQGIWNNSASNITSLTVASTLANGFGAGSQIELWSIRNSAGSNQWVNTASDIYFNTGNVGVGTTAPASKLDVATPGAVANETGLSLRNPSTAAYSTTNMNFYTAGAWKSSLWTMRDNTGDGTILGISTANSGGSAQERLRIDAAGDVGIGTTDPAQTLDVQGPVGMPATSGTTQNGIVRVRAAGSQVSMDMGVNNAAPANAWIQASSATALGTNYNLLLNPNGGNVGIGTTGPNSKLEVKDGNIAVSGTGKFDLGMVRVSNTATSSGYVDAVCPGTKKIITGGCISSGIAFDHNYPVSNTEWRCRGVSGGSITAYAVCGDVVGF